MQFGLRVLIITIKYGSLVYISEYYFLAVEFISKTETIF